MAKFQIKKSDNGQYYYHLRATGNNEIILRSTQYKTKVDCEKEVASVKINAPLDARYSRLKATDGQYYFNLNDASGVIGTSEMYKTEANREHGIKLVKDQAPTAPVEYIN